MLRSSSTAMLVETVVEESQAQFMSTLSLLVFQTPLASNTVPTTSTKREVASQLISAETAPGHLPQLVKLVLTSAGLLTTKNITSLTITVLADQSK